MMIVVIGTPLDSFTTYAEVVEHHANEVIVASYRDGTAVAPRDEDDFEMLDYYRDVRRTRGFPSYGTKSVAKMAERAPNTRAHRPARRIHRGRREPGWPSYLRRKRASS